MASKNVFLNKTVSVTPVQSSQIQEEHMEPKDYVCANPLAIYGSAPRNTAECLDKFFPGHTQIAAINDMVGKLRPSKMDLLTSDPETQLIIYEEDPEPDGCTLTCSFTKIKMCDKIDEKMGDTFLGCFYAEPNAPFSCDCPAFGSDYPKLLTAALKNSTFWNTPLEAPLARRAFMSFLNATKIRVTIDGTFSLRPGYKVNIVDYKNLYGGEMKGKLNGDWIISSINHRIFKDRHQESTLTLVRVYDDNNSINTSTATTNVAPIIAIER